LETADHASLALDSGEANCANLFAIEASPSLTVKVSNKRNNVFWVQKIDKGIANIAVILEINR